MKDEEVKEFDYMRYKFIPLLVMALCLLFPVNYEFTQVIKQGSFYFTSISNYLDIGYVVLGYFNIFNLLYTEGKLSLYGEILFICTIFATVVKKFKSMKS
jgi:hypothetical protein